MKTLLRAGLALLTFSQVFGGWVPVGPAPVRDGQIENVVPDDQISGAIHVVTPHPTDPEILYVGTVNGGVWRTTNASASMPQWTPLTGDFAGSIGALVFDPTDGTHQTLVAARGQFSSFFVGGPFRGLLRTTDGGDSWTELFDPLLVASLTGVAARGQTLVATASPQFSGGGGGLFRSTDSGASWSRLDGDGSSGLAPASPGYTDLVGDPNVTNRLYTANRDDKLYRSTDTGATWTPISTTNLDLSDALADSNNVEMAVSSAGRLWVTVLQGGRPGYVGYTDNPGGLLPTWIEMDLPLTPESVGAVSDASSMTPIVISTATAAVTDATDATPVVIASAGHGLASGDAVLVSGVTGNDGANGGYFITVLDADSFELQGSVGTGAYAGGGTWTQFHLLGSGDQVQISGVTGNTAANGRFRVTTVGNFAFELDGSAENGGYTGGGVWQGLEGTNPGGQGFVHSSIVADPTDPAIVYLGGDAQPSPFPNFIGANNFSGRLFRGNSNVAPSGTVPSPQWENLTNDNVPAIPGGGTASSSAPHADSREMAFDAAGNLVETSDGGIYRRTNPADNSGDWFSINGSLQVTEIHDVAYDTLSDVIMGGTQDNGTVEQTASGSFEWANILGGDGGDVDVDATSTPGMSVRYRSAQFLGAFSRDFYDASGAFVVREFPALEVVDGSTSGSDFVTPIELNVVDPTRLIIGRTTHVYESFDQGDTLFAIDPFDPDNPGAGPGANWDAMAYGGFLAGVPNPDVIYFGNNADVHVRAGAAPDPPVLTCLPDAGFVLDLVLDPDDWTTAYILTGSTVWKMEGTGTTCTDVTGDLSTLTDFGLVRIEFVEGSPERIAVTGVFDNDSDVKVMDVSAPGVWTSLGPGLPDTVLYELEYDAADDILVAGSMGRGAFVFDVSCAPGSEAAWYRDLDGDGFGDPGFAVSACIQPPGFVADDTDCRVNDGALWAAPESPSRDLRFGPDKETLGWAVPLLPGGAAGTTRYDTIRSSDPTDFTAGAVCLESDDGSDLAATDVFVPGPGTFEAYLNRPENDCGPGPVGAATSGARPGQRDCP